MDKINILMVDDHPGKLLTYETILGELGENLLKAHSGGEALQCLLNTDVAVVLMDVSMPELDGFQLSELIHQHPRFQDLAIIFISGVHMTDSDRLRGYEHGAVDYISVPIVPALLRAKVRVFAELHRKTRELESLHSEMQKLSSRMITMQDQERRKIARELHDSLGQELTAAKMTVDGIRAVEAQEQVAEASGRIARVLQQVRTISHLLHPPLLEELGLESALRWYLEGLTKRSGIEISLDVQAPDSPRPAPELENAIYRIVQEALTNVFRHSGARKASVTLLRDNRHITVRVRDDGKGLTERTVRFQPGSVGVGIGGMRQRAKEFGGQLRLQNTRPGTLVEITIPVPPVEVEQMAP
jgi:signal transduction histidine kinase